jgi:Polysaccharide pyruvyl transferase
MNLIVAASRQWTPEHEWIFLGVRHLIENTFSRRFNWVLYDKNPDLRETKGSHVHRLRLKSNSFHHHTLLPFSAAVIAGTSEWHGEEMELFYGSLSKIDIPLFALGMEKPDTHRKLTSVELGCLSREENLITVKDEASRHWLSENGLSSTLVPCPSLFASGEDHFPSLTQTPQRRVGVILQDSQRPGSAPPETIVRKLCQTVARLSRQFKVEVICPTLDDFMRFSTMFPDQVRYSYEARDYLALIAECDVLVTTRMTFALVANSVLRPALLISEAEVPDSNFLPYVQSCQLGDLKEKITKLFDQPALPSSIFSWKDQLKNQWQTLLTRHEPRSSKTQIPAPRASAKVRSAA